MFVKDESLNPTNSFKARGLSAAVTRAAHLGARTLSIPSAGNAANAMAAYAAAAGIPAQVFMPKDVKVPFIRECELYGATVNLVDGLITDAGRIAAEKGKPLGWYDVSTLKEPYRIEGKKTMAYELGEQLEWNFPDWIIYPTGGGTGMVGMWKAFDEMERIGWKAAGRRPKMVSVQAEHCAPIVRAFDQGAERSEMWQNAGPSPTACGCRKRSAISSSCAPFARAAARRSRSSDADMVADMRELGSKEGISAAPEGGAALQRAEGAGGRRTRQADRHGRPVQYGRCAEIPRRADSARRSPRRSLGRRPDQICRATSPSARARCAPRRNQAGRCGVRPTTFSSGTATMSGGWNATMCPNWPSSSSSTARAPNRVARMRSKLVGAPPRCR